MPATSSIIVSTDHIQETEGTEINPKTNFSLVSDIIRALQDILARSNSSPHLETPYSEAGSPDANNPAIEFKDRTVIITERQQQLDAVVHEISGLQTVMDSINNLRQQLAEKKDKITQSMNSHKRLASALWRFPTEILSHIFMHCLPKDKYLSPDSKLPPVLLTRICRRWRDVAVGTSGLWCRLFVDVRHRDWQKTAFGCDSWLKRSQRCPLSLAVKCVGNDMTDQQNLLWPYMNQISSLYICFSSSYPRRSIGVSRPHSASGADHISSSSQSSPCTMGLATAAHSSQSQATGTVVRHRAAIFIKSRMVPPDKRPHRNI
ncbi:hypothetical protein DFJ58DRAFT_97554 [Suillus subalutaceus]|uniref:uncharacterized protein n=1 Tax=Suillus subalutaceus TaxID=48586 RepID=UPI001B87F646|nr:uncharacterized protein DFJ58DRAFT_97554 [Suillus subalutaceus]KAG1868256.1 hypothetical protein DFJ58DRAFT_97554 [Suillus subalutaceus]